MHKTLRLTLFIIIGTLIAGFWSGASVSAARAISPLTPAKVRLSGFDSFAPSLIRSQNYRGTSTCLGERATDVVQAGESWSGSDEDEVVIVLGEESVASANGGDDKICVYGSPGRTGLAGSYIFGGNGDDTIITYGASNNIDAGTGNDLIYLNGHDESVTALEGDDHIWGLGAEQITAYGGSGNDLIVGSHGDDFIIGGDDNDVVLGNGGDDEIMGLFGSNQLYGGSGQDTIDGGADYDLCHDFDQNTTFTHCEDIIQPPGPPLPEAG